MFAEERRQEIINQLKKEGRVLANNLAEHFQVSIDTIRRDLSIMEEKGLLKRTHGGAIEAKKVRSKPEQSSIRYSEGTPQQNAIAKLAATFIEQGDTVFIGGASLHYVMLKYLPTDVSYSVVTNSIVIADRLKDYDNIEIYMTCGKMRKCGTLSDAFSIEFIRSLRLDIAFLTGGGLSAEHGLSTSTSEGAIFYKAVSEVSKKKICLATYDKLGNESFIRTTDTKNLDFVVTDWDSPMDEIDKLEKLGVKVLIARYD